MSPEALAGLSARRAARFPDARVSHFIDLEPRLGERLAPVLELPKDQLAWDVFLLYAPGIEWGEAPPKPASWMHQLDRGPPGKHLDAARLAVETEKLLTAKETNRGADSVKVMFGDNWCMPKGGLGIIHKGLYIVLKGTTKNELLLEDDQTWTGKDVTKPEVVVVFSGKAWSPQALPDEFDLSNSIVISFENDKVRFFDFTRMEGCYYKRPKY